MIYVMDKNGTQHTVEFFTRIYKKDNGKQYADLYVDGCKMHTLQIYFRSMKTWDDYWGNTPSGYYCNVPINRNETRRIYFGPHGRY